MSPLFNGMPDLADASRDVEAETVAAEAEARKFYLFRFHTGYLTWRVTSEKVLSISQCGWNGEVAL